MTDLVIEYMKRADIIQLLAIGIMFWFFYNRLDGKLGSRLDKLETKMDKLETKIDRVENSLNARMDRLETKIETEECVLNARMDKIDTRIERLTEQVIDIKCGLNRIEGNLNSQGHCLFHQKQQQNEPKAL